MDDDTVSFGFQTIKAHEKAGRVKGVFSSVARQYDQMNDLMSFGLHRLWKEDMVRAVRLPRTDAPCRVLDVACGTGDLTFSMAAASGQGTRLFGLDLSEPMVHEACRRSPEQSQRDRERCSFLVGDAQKLPFPADFFDVYTIGFGLRNVTDPLMALREAHRVLKPGGRFFCLEFSPPKTGSFLKPWYDFYSFSVLPALGQVVAQDGASYRYLVESIRKFFSPEALGDLMEEAGFSKVRWRSLSSGIVSVHQGWVI